MACCSLANGKFSFSKCSLVLCNLVFSLVGAVLLALSLFVRLDSDWQTLFDTPNGGFSMLYYCMALGSGILILSILGMRAALRESKCLLSLYLLVVLLALVAQAFIATVLFQFNDTVTAVAEDKTGISYDDLTSVQRDVLQKIGDSTSSIYVNGDCTTLQEAPLKIECSASNAGWFQKFVNEKCTAQALPECLTSNAGRNTLASVRIWCRCQNAVSAQLKTYSKPLTIAAIALAVVELLLVLSAFYLLCCYNRRHAEEEKRRQEVDHGYRPHNRPIARGSQPVGLV